MSTSSTTTTTAPPKSAASVRSCAANPTSTVFTSILQDREHLLARQLRATVEADQLDEKRQPQKLASELLHEPRGRGRRPTGCQHIVHDQHALSALHRIGVDLERIFAVLQVVGL